MRRFSYFFPVFLTASSLFGAANGMVPSSLPAETGMYQRDHSGNWQEIEANVFNWKTGGVLKTFFTLGIVKPDLNANLWRRSAIQAASYQDEFLVVVPDGMSIGEYQLIQFHEHSKSREFRMVTGGIFHVSSGGSRDRQEFSAKKIAARTYLVSFETYQGGGQFGFLPPPSFNPTKYAFGRIYCFEMRN